MNWVSPRAIWLTGAIGNIEFDTGYRIIWAIFAVAPGTPVYYGMGAPTKLHERGIISARFGKTINGRWEDVPHVSYKTTRYHIVDVTPVPWQSHSITITHTNR